MGEKGPNTDGRQGTLYPILLKLEQQVSITSDWEQKAAIIGRFFSVKAEDLQ